jgi:hypothetical protein
MTFEVTRRIVGAAFVLVTTATLLASSGNASGTSRAYAECGNPAGPAANVTTVAVSCADGRAFARKVAKRRVTHNQRITLSGWHAYYAKVRRIVGKYDIRATRDRKVIHFQYSTGEPGTGSDCDPNYAGVCLDPNSPDYDCAGGSGDGPDYTGEVRVIGDDHFDLDRDGDGIGCD